MGARLVILVVAATFVACSHELPEDGTPAAALYRERCGMCHRAYAPSSLKAAMWEMILPNMEGRMRAARVVPLSPEERTAILDYLKRNAG